MQYASALKAAGSLLAAALAASAAHASLIGDTVQFRCVNCYSPTSDLVRVEEDSPGLTLFQQFRVDVDARSVRITWLVPALFIIPELTFELSDLDFSREAVLAGVSIDPGSTWGERGASKISYWTDGLEFVNGYDRFAMPGDYLQLNLQLEQRSSAFVANALAIPAPGSLLLLALGAAGLGWSRSRRH